MFSQEDRLTQSSLIIRDSLNSFYLHLILIAILMPLLMYVLCLFVPDETAHQKDVQQWRARRGDGTYGGAGMGMKMEDGMAPEWRD